MGLTPQLLHSLFPLMVVMSAVYALLLAPLSVALGPASFVANFSQLVFYAGGMLLLSRSLLTAMRMMLNKAGRKIADLVDHQHVKPTSDNASEIFSSFSAMVQMALLAMTLFPTVEVISTCRSVQPDVAACIFPFTYQGIEYGGRCAKVPLPTADALGECWPGNATTLRRSRDLANASDWQYGNPPPEYEHGWCAAKADVVLEPETLAGQFVEQRFFGGQFVPCTCEVPQTHSQAESMASVGRRDAAFE